MRNQAIQSTPVIISHGDHLHIQGEVNAEHQQLHNNIALGAIIFIVFAQIGVHFWKAKHMKSFSMFTLAGLWTIPFILSFQAGYWRFISIWAIFSIVTIAILWKASRNTLQKLTPRLIYSWFFVIYRGSYFLAIAGYVMVVLEIVGLPRTILEAIGVDYQLWVSRVGFLFMFYGLYYGVLVRDCAGVCTSLLAQRMGFVSVKDEEDVPARRFDPNQCGICQEPLNKETVRAIGDCKHEFHEFCLRGWSIIGKKETCPKCAEKVDIKKMVQHEWQSENIWYINLLDLLHYLLVWNPIIILAIKVATNYIDPHNPGDLSDHHH